MRFNDFSGTKVYHPDNLQLVIEHPSLMLKTPSCVFYIFFSLNNEFNPLPVTKKVIEQIVKKYNVVAVHYYKATTACFIKNFETPFTLDGLKKPAEKSVGFSFDDTSS